MKSYNDLSSYFENNTAAPQGDENGSMVPFSSNYSSFFLIND